MPPPIADGLRRVVDACLAVLVPRTCPLCSREIAARGAGLCLTCRGAVEAIEEPLCSRCGAPLPGAVEIAAADGLCAACAVRTGGRLPALVVRSAAAYTGLLREAILRVKFGGETALARSLGNYLTERFPVLFPLDAFDRILPVPLHPKRLRQRAFNQSVLLARPLARRLALPLDLHSAARVRHTPAQSGSTERERRENLRGAFRVQRPWCVRGKSILLVDDVYTTGATLEVLGAALLGAGAGKVSAVTLARAPHRAGRAQDFGPWSR